MDIVYSLEATASNINESIDLKLTSDVKGASAMTGMVLNALIEKSKEGRDNDKKKS